MIAEMVKKHSSEASCALDDPLEAAVFSMLVELMKERDQAIAKQSSSDYSESLASQVVPRI